MKCRGKATDSLYVQPLVVHSRRRKRPHSSDRYSTNYWRWSWLSWTEENGQTAQNPFLILSVSKHYSLPIPSFSTTMTSPPTNTEELSNLDDGKEGSSVTGNPYLALREANIARNQARLRELGLVPSLNQAKQEDSPGTSRTRRQKTRTTTTPNQEQSTTIVRRSRRLSQQPEPALKEAIEEEPLQTRPQKRKRASVLLLQGSDVATTTTTIPVRAGSSPAPPKANSVRSVFLDVKRLVLGSGSDDATTTRGGLLGLPMDQTGKAFVINQSFDIAASEEDQLRLTGVHLSFNKYSGVQEWGNDVAFLWVNIGGTGNSVVNEFSEGGKHMTWFGGSRMHDESPVILQLLRIGRLTAKEEGSQPKGIESNNELTSSALLPSSSGIVLWCRLYQSDTRTFGPYICLGRLAYASHVPRSSPIEFLWKLLDYDTLQNHPNESTRQLFQRIISS